MRIFQLTPIKPEENAKDWLSSTTKESVIVRSDSEESARKLVAFATGLAREKFGTTYDAPLSPWYSNKHVLCVEYVGQQYNFEGNEEILSPVQIKKNT